MRTFIACAQKEFYHILRDRRTVMILLALPIVQLLLFGFALNTEVNHLRFAVLGELDGGIERQLVETMEHSGYFTLVDKVNDRRDIDRLFRRRSIDLALVIPPDFTRHLLVRRDAHMQLELDASDPNVASIAQGYMQGILNRVLVASRRGAIPQHVEFVPRMLYNPTLKSTYNFVPGVMGLVLIVICGVMTSVSLVREKESGTIEVLFASPLRISTLLVAKLVPYMVIAYVDLVAMLLLSYFALDVPIQGSLVLLWVIVTLYILLALAMGLLVSAAAKTQAVAIIVAGIATMMPSMMFSGMMFQLSGMPKALQYVAELVPAKWFIDAVRCVMIQGGGWREVAPNLFVLAGMGAAFVGLALRKQKKRL